MDHHKLWKILKEMGIPDHLTCLLRSHAGQEATIRTGHGTTDWFQTGKGVRQGCILSLCLFNLYAEFSSVQFSRSVVSNSLRPHESQYARPPCPSPTPGVHSNSRPSSQGCHPAISSSVPFSSCPQSLPASEAFPMSQFFALGGQSTGASAEDQSQAVFSLALKPSQIPLPLEGTHLNHQKLGLKGTSGTSSLALFFTPPNHVLSKLTRKGPPSWQTVLRTR